MDVKLNPTQQRVFDYMAENGSITSFQSCSELGETRLSARIFELKAKGINISSEIIEVKNRYGENRHVKKYYLG